MGSCVDRIVIEVILEYSDGELTHGAFVGFGGGGNFGFKIGWKVEAEEYILLLFQVFNYWFGGGGVGGCCHVPMVKVSGDSCTSVYHLQGYFRVFLRGRWISCIVVFQSDLGGGDCPA